MARPKKQEVDYFPHYCTHGKVLFVLENHFKNNGYAVFYKLCEIVGSTNGHCYDCSKLENWEFLLSKMLVNEDIVINIINKLSAMGVVDPKLWKEKQIWIQSFVDSVIDVYGRRSTGIPIKPELLHTETPLKGVIDDINPQSKVKESKVKKTKEASFVLPDWIPQETWDAYLQVRATKKAAQTPYAFKLIIKELLKIKSDHGHNPIDVLNKSIKSGWADVYPIKEGGLSNGQQQTGYRTGQPPERPRIPEWKGSNFDDIPEAERKANIEKLRAFATK